MKKKIAIIAALLALAVTGLTVSAQTATTTVRYKADPSYMVTIPTQVEIPFNQLTWNYGTISIDKLLLDEGQSIQIKLDSNGKLKNQENPNSVIPYQVLSNGEPFISQKYTTAGVETPLTISILQKDWDQAAGGTYTASVIFDISIVSLDQ